MLCSSHEEGKCEEANIVVILTFLHFTQFYPATQQWGIAVCKDECTDVFVIIIKRHKPCKDSLFAICCDLALTEHLV